MIKNPLSELNFVEGEVLLFDKPFEWTSFDLVRKIRSQIRKNLGKSKIKVGHAGTLDPLATGLMIICTGRKTKQIEKFQATEKEYIAELFLGATTPSYDLETEIDKEYSIDHITNELIESTLKTFIGEQEQIPPAFSAKWIDGKRAYVNARQGIEMKMKPSIITIHEIELIENNMPELKIRIKCSKGTYIRSLANDIGIALKSGAYMSGLRRTKIGSFHVKEAMQVEEFKLSEAVKPLTE